MDKQALERELDFAYKALEKAENQVKNLLIERRETSKIIAILKAAELIDDQHMQKARALLAKNEG